jgi:hypothetical protein
MPKSALLVNVCEWLSSNVGTWVLSMLGALFTNALPLWNAAAVSDLIKIPTNIIETWWLLTLFVALLVCVQTLERLFGRRGVRWRPWATTKFALAILAVAILVSLLLPDESNYIFSETIDRLMMVALLQVFSGGAAVLLSVATYLALKACATAKSPGGSGSGT